MNEVKNPRFSAADKMAIDVEWNHPQLGWIPFTATPGDVMPYSREIYNRALAGEFGEVAPFDPPDFPVAE